MFSYMCRKRKSGFTLLELIVVMAVIAIMVAMGVPRFIGYQKDAGVTAMKADCKVLEDACMICYTEEDGWPVGTGAGETLSGVIFEGDEEVTNITAKPIDSDKIKDLYRSLKNDLGEYYLVDDGNYEGIVIHAAGIEDRGGETWHGINLLKEAD